MRRSPRARPRRSFAGEFKIEAARRITEQGRGLAEVARDLGLSQGMLRSWKQARAAGGVRAVPGPGNLPAVAEELRRLRAENQRLRAEREIVKKATASFARESSRGTRSSRPIGAAGRSG